MRSNCLHSWILIGVLCAGIAHFISSFLIPHYSSFFLPIKAPLGTIQAFLATSSIDQEKGLGNRNSLPYDQGMLFEFANPGRYGFWMKNMRFPLDIVWVDKNKVVAGVMSDIPVNSYPNIFFPPRDIFYVLELNAGGAERFGLATGTMLEL